MKTMEQEMRHILEKARKERVFPGCVVGVIEGSKKYVVPFGTLTYDSTSPEVGEETVYDIASITKAIPTSSLALSLLDQRQLSLTDNVSDFLPEVTSFKKDAVTVWHLLTQTLKWDIRLSQQKQLSSESLWQKLCATPLQEKPGTSYAYSNATSIMLSQVIERVTGKSLDSLAHEYFFEPLIMNRTTFYPTAFASQEIAPSEVDSWRGREVRGEVHDESAFILREKMIVGSAGLFSTVPDLLKFLTMLLADGVWEGKRYLSAAILREIETNQISYTGEWHGLGWELNQPWYMGTYTTPTTFGKTGFTGCHVVADRQRQKALVLLSNSTYPIRPKSKDAINEVRRALGDTVFG